ncbi:MAG TPA: ABC transporter substrate-binding protein, partial [Thermoanaerobaculia bacterium]|nr:ABC transporter substrate-binding protein [Thermoanaerobaculia bacterium]
MRRLLPCLLLVLIAAAVPLAAAEPLKVATLLPYIEEALRAAAPGRARVVAGVRRTEGGALAQGVSDLGSPHAPNFERLAASGAEVVVVDERIHKALEPRLRAVGVEVLSVRGDSVEGTFAGIQTAARRAGADREMAARVQEARKALQRLALPRPVPVLVLFGAPGSFLVVTSDTWLGDLL